MRLPQSLQPRPAPPSLRRGTGDAPRAGRPSAPANAPASTLRKAPESSACSCGGGCPRCQAGSRSALHLQDTASQAPAPPTSEPGGATERAADAMAREALRPGPLRTAASLPGEHAAAPLPAPLRHELQHRFHADLGHVRLHRGPFADQAARQLGAQAYALESDIVLGQGWQPASPAGQHTLAHEVAHTVQAARGQAPRHVAHRQLGGPMGGGLGGGMTPSDADMAAEREYGNGPPPPSATTCGRPSHCPPGFCDPHRTVRLAEYYRARNGPILMAGIAAAVNSRVVPLWRDYLNGGSAPRNLTATFGADFTASPTTRNVTAFVLRALGLAAGARLASLPLGTSQVVTLATFLPHVAAAIDNPAGAMPMNFNIPGDIPGNLAGGIGKDQTTCPSGAMPSPFNDERILGGTATVTRIAPDRLQVMPDIRYTVRDTIDLCPGDCGTPLEQIATIPLSQFEATGISGDVPFTVEFPAPTVAPLSIPVAATAPSPAPGPSPAPSPVPPPPPAAPMPGVLPPPPPVPAPTAAPAP